VTFTMTFYFTAIKKLNAIIQWVGYSSVTLSDPVLVSCAIGATHRILFGVL